MAEINASTISLKNLLKYCLGYVKLINPSLSRYKLSTDPIDETILSPDELFAFNPNEEAEILLNLKEFYELNPKDLTDENKEAYLKQKSLALKLEEIKNKFKVDEYTKQINLNFGYFKVEVPEDENIAEEDQENSKPKTRSKNDIYPLFSIPVEITFTNNKYYLGILDHNVIPNIGFLQDVLKEETYFDFVDFISQLEIDGQLTLPLDNSVITKVWEELKGRLKLSDAQFDENSFELSRFVVSLSSKSNYFLVQDLKNLVESPEEELVGTSLGSWILDENLSEQTEVSEDSGELFFPFDYDKYQLRALSIIGNKAAIIQGPPGTGKSQTIANLLAHLAAGNKKVLFLSQKAQALKVVKDKLKQLNIEYLYGYIPNRFSQVYSPDEEADGASNTLAGIQQYLSFIHDRQRLSDNQGQTNIKATEDYFNNATEQQRTFFYLFNQKNSLEPYVINPPSMDKYVERFSQESYSEFKALQSELEETENQCGEYVKGTTNLAQLRTKFELVSESVDGYCESIGGVIEEIEKSGFDRRNRVGRFITTSLLYLRLRPVTAKLPREVYEAIEVVTKEDYSKAEAIRELKKLLGYFKFVENEQKSKVLSEKLELSLLEMGLDNKSLGLLEKIIEKEGIERAIELTKKRIDVEKQIKLIELVDLNSVNKSLHSVRDLRKERVKYFIQNRIKKQIVDATYSATIKGILARISKALRKSKRAYRTFDQLKSDPTNFQTLKEVVPIWIMDLEDASRLIPLQKNMFDYIVLDEASQCNLAYAIPAMYRSQHVIFFGDSEQMRDDSIKFKTNRSLEELAKKFKIPVHLQIKGKGDTVQSVLDIGQNRGFQERTLLYHYRSPKEIIGFSNDYFYAPKKKQMEVINTNYLPYKDSGRIMVNHFVKPRRDEDVSEKTNLAEAKYIAKLVQELKSDESTKDKSIGVLTFFNEQALLLKQVIDDDSVKVAIIEGIQGDEKDIIIYSFVICSPDEKKRYIALAGEGGEINKDLNAGRVNVAFSRARKQVHCVTSMRPEEWPEGIWIKRYLEYVEANGTTDFYSQQLKKFDSYFEEEFYHLINKEFSKKLTIQNQVESCGFKIDFVISDPKSGKRLAIECDGPTHFEDEITDIYVTSDVERQSVLERAGWVFYRIAYSDWVDKEFDKSQITRDIGDYFQSSVKFLNQVKTAEVKPMSSVEAETVDEHESPEQSTNSVPSKPATQAKGFKEIARQEIDTRRDLVASLIENGKSVWINEYYKQGSYIGFSNKGVGVGTNDLGEFVKKSLKTVETNEGSEVAWKGDGKSKIMIRPVDSLFGSDVIDVRQYVESASFTGFTKRGFRMGKDQFREFVMQLEKQV